MTANRPEAFARYAFYDTETTGARVRFDHPHQVAFIVTDANFNEIDRISLRCRPRRWNPPSPIALLVTNSDPAELAAQKTTLDGLLKNLVPFLKKHSPAVFIGYNTLSFDEEILRQALWENLRDPYPTSKAGSRRADLMRIIQTARAADPDVLAFETKPDGKPSFKLESLAKANGFDEHLAHDALGDVLATIFLAKKVKARAPKLWNRLISNAAPDNAAKIVDSGRAFVEVTRFGEDRVRVLFPVARDPEVKRHVGCVDLAIDPAPFVEMDENQLAKAMTEDFKALPVIKTNAMPCVFPVEEAIELGFNLPDQLDGAGNPERDENGNPHPDWVQPARRDELNRIVAKRVDAVSTPDFRLKWIKATAIRRAAYEPKPYVETAIYDGFPSKLDEKLMEDFHRANAWAEKLKIAATFRDPRFVILAERLVLDNAPSVLPQARRTALENELLRERLLTKFPEETTLTGKPVKAPWLALDEVAKELAELPDTPLAEKIKAWWIKRINALGLSVSIQIAPKNDAQDVGF
jgi:exodeoxyribonuclease-1